MFFFFLGRMMASNPRGEPGPMPAPVTRLAEPLKRFHKEAWHTPQGRLIREVIFGLNDGVISTIGFLAGVTATIGDLHTVALGGLAEETFDPPVRIAAVTGFAYLTGALITLVPYFLHPAPPRTFAAAAALSVATLLVTGAAKTWLTKENPVAASLELAGLGVLACVVGFVLGRLVGVAV